MIVFSRLTSADGLCVRGRWQTGQDRVVSEMFVVRRQVLVISRIVRTSGIPSSGSTAGSRLLQVVPESVLTPHYGSHYKEMLSENCLFEGV